MGGGIIGGGIFVEKEYDGYGGPFARCLTNVYGLILTKPEGVVAHTMDLEVVIGGVRFHPKLPFITVGQDWRGPDAITIVVNSKWLPEKERKLFRIITMWKPIPWKDMRGPVETVVGENLDMRIRVLGYKRDGSAEGT